jgi:hypothetical protein
VASERVRPTFPKPPPVRRPHFSRSPLVRGLLAVARLAQVRLEQLAMIRHLEMQEFVDDDLPVEGGGLRQEAAIERDPSCGGGAALLSGTWA